MIDTETKRLTADIDAVRRHVDREANVRRLTERYRAGNLSVGPSEIFGAALYVASLAWHYWEEPDDRRRDEWGYACDVVRQRLDARPRRIAEALLESTESLPGVHRADALSG